MTRADRLAPTPGSTRRAGLAGAVAVGWLVAAASVAGALPRSEVDGGTVDRTVDDVLRHRDFSAVEQSWLERLREDVRQWFLERLADLFSSGAGTVLAWVLIGAAVLLAVAVGVAVARGMRRGARADDPVPSVVVTRRAPTDWLADARAAQDAGDHAEAVRCAYRAVVARLASHGAVEEQPGRTVGEYRSQLQRRAATRLDEFTRASDVFERVWYARRPATSDDVETVVGVADALAGGR